MQERFISLLYPDEASQIFHQDIENLPNVSETVCDELGLTDLFNLKSSSLSDYFTADERVISYRQQTMEDILSLPSLKETLSKVHPILDDIRELYRLDTEKGGGESYLYGITAIELYVSCIDVLKEGFLPIKDEVKSAAFKNLFDFLLEIADSEYYRELNEKLSALTSRVHEVKSVTIGVNLDRELRPESAGVISVNSETFKSGKTLDKILRLSFKNDAFTTIAELSPLSKGQSDNKKEALVAAFHSAIEDVFKSSVKGWKAIVGEYVLDNTDFLLKLLPEIEFVSKSADLIKRLEAHEGCSVCIPKIAPMSDKAFCAKGLYNPRVAMAIDDPIVTNDLELDDNARIYVLTGPNRGGKSVITVALGAAEAMMMLGLPVPAESATVSPVDGIYTHFPEGADDTIDKGRLGEECARLREIFDSVTENAMVLLDESLSSTGAYEAAYIASEILTGFAVIGARGIFSTHLHELAAKVAEINETSAQRGGVSIDTLVAGMEQGQRSFKITRAKPDGKSYAKDIADKYGLSFDSLIAKHGKETDK